MILEIDPGTTQSGFVVGSLCRRKHAYSPGHSLRYLSGSCVRCQSEKAKVRRGVLGPEMDAKRAEWAAKNPDKVKSYLATYRANNRDIILKRAKEYRQASLAERAAYQRRCRRLKPEVMKAIEARRMRSHEARAAFNEYRKSWAAVNKHKIREYAHKRSHVRLQRLPRGTIRRIGDLQKWKCASCRASIKADCYHKDHIIPLAKGGEHAPRNIQLLCPPCNLRKGARDPVYFMQLRGFLL